MNASMTDTPEQLLTAAYQGLEFSRGDLVSTSDSPETGYSGDEWRSKGEWLILGQRMGAEKIFFVSDDPVVVFASLPSGADESEIIATYRRAWSMGRARCLFVAVEGELRVYALNELPPRTLADQSQLNALMIVSRAADVAEVLADYHRNRLESGLLFENPEYLDRTGRSDERLLRDVEAATDALEMLGLPRAAAHALIERVILVRYLEDRKVISQDYFARIASRFARWTDLLNRPPIMPMLGAQSTFVSCLSDVNFTYAIFDELALTFNGDMFVVDDVENSNIEERHLELVRQMLTGEDPEGQNPLFLWAYDFSIVPTSLISSMYEQFYRAGTDDDKGTHYTPPELAEYVIAQTLTPEVMRRAPRICDPACGSGIFLVEAFRRLVRDEMARIGGRLSSERLRALLLTRISGVDINPEAIRLAAFSLYLAYLNYQEPPDIAAAGRLPRLIFRSSDPPANAVLVVADAFSPLLSETLPIDMPLNQEMTPGQLEASPFLPWPEQYFDIVIGNPPWDEPNGVPVTADEIWARKNGYHFGDRSKSQLFMWRALSFLKPEGTAALLIAATAFHNVRSGKFRSQWLNSATLSAFVDFSSARRMFFRGGAAPFALAVFGHMDTSNPPSRLVYRNVLPSAVLQGTRSMAYAHTERRWVSQQALQRRDYLWKTYAWGGHRDAALMARLDAEIQLKEIAPRDPVPAWGYQYSGPKSKIKKEASDYLKSIPSLNTFEVWGPIQTSWFEDPPEFVSRAPDERRYSGQRLLITEGVRSGFGPNARLVTGHYSFRHKIYCVPLHGTPEWRAKTLLAIFLSSLGRYRLFMRSGSWALWHDKVNAEDILAMPVRFGDEHDGPTQRIVDAVDRLSTVNMQQEFEQLDLAAFFDGVDRLPAGPSYTELLEEINDAVFDLFEFSPAERDLVRDFHTYTLDIAGKWRNSSGLQAVTLPTVTAGTIHDILAVDAHPIREYLDRFLTEWNEAIKPDAELAWQVVGSPRSEFIGAIFQTQEEDLVDVATPADVDWPSLLDRLSTSLFYPASAVVATEGMLRSVSETSIVVIKRREARLWSASAGREDAEATMLQTMTLQEG